MAQKPLRPKIAWKVLDNDTGTVQVQELPHIDSEVTVRGLQQGIPGATSIGDGHIWLPPVNSRLWNRYAPFVSKLQVGQRFEGYLGGVVGGNPRYSMILTDPPALARDSPTELMLHDSLWQLQQTHLYPGEPMGAGGSFRQMVDIMRGVRKIVWDDDFSNWSGATGVGHTSSDYTAAAGWSVQNDPQFGQPSLGNSTAGAGGSLVTTNATWNAISQYNWPTVHSVAAASMVSIEGVMVAGTDTTYANTAEILFLKDVSNALTACYLVRATMRQTGVGTGLYNVRCEIWSVVGGVSTLQVTGTDIFPNVPATFPFELQAVTYTLGTSYVVQLFLNGKDAQCKFSFTSAPVAASGGVGIRTAWNAGGSPATYFNSLRFEGRTGVNFGTARFVQGSFVTNFILPQTITSNEQSHLDMMMLASTVDGVFIRKDPGVGPDGDTINYIAQPGTDWSQSITFEDGRNCRVDLAGPTVDLFARSTKVTALPGVDSGGSLNFSPVLQAGQLVFSENVADIGTPGATMLKAYARSVGTRKAGLTSLNNQAVQITIKRIIRNVDRFRELDFVTLHAPKYGFFRQKVQVLGYTIRESSAEMVLFLVQFPEGMSTQLGWRRLKSTVHFVANTYASR